ncbi:hypothetical protein [Burkholderia metallica]|uniref:hypothetical protein n=1 Tax=Burkholderia metallica TaxID=488729 RepID=UPI00158D1A3D|nr:hypothetical protein [Burkholderia metallica]
MRKEHESIETNDWSTIANLRASIDAFRRQFIVAGSTMADARPARPIVARCASSRPDARQVRTRCATHAGPREKYRRAGLRGPLALDSRATRTTLEYASRNPRPAALPRTRFSARRSLQDAVTLPHVRTLIE